MKYQSKIVGLGPDALAFLDDEDMNFIIIFNEDAPPELAELSVLHTKAELKEDPAVGDTFRIGKKEYKVSAVGWKHLILYPSLAIALWILKVEMKQNVQDVYPWKEKS